MGDIRASLKALLPLLDCKLARHSGAMRARAGTEFEAAETTPFVAAAEGVRAIGPQVAMMTRRRLP